MSPDGLLLQSSTVADSISFKFSDGVTESVPCSYIEFAERLVLPEYKNLPDREVTTSSPYLFNILKMDGLEENVLNLILQPDLIHTLKSYI